MKAVTIEEFRDHIDEYLAEAANDEVILTQDGKPWLVLRAAGENGAIDSQAFANSKAFWQMIDQRRKEKGIPWEEAKKQLDLDD
jgi:antitoxin (DNA-binding transcriptional repressor) of toxin-antitoxin stability system